MSLLIADQEGRGGNGDSGSVREDSIMGVNLAEGYKAVNDDERRGLFGLSGLSRRRTDLSWS